MKSLSALIQQYKVAPSQILKDEIFNRVLMLEDVSIIDQAEIKIINSEWFIFDANIRVKLVGNRKYKIADVFGIPGGNYVCYSYIIDLTPFSNEELEGYKNNCIDFAEKAPDEDSFCAFAIAKTIDASATYSPYFASNSDELQKWYEQL